MVVNTVLVYSFSFILRDLAPIQNNCISWTVFTVVPFSIAQSNVNKFWSNRKSGAGATRGGPGNRKLTNRGGTRRCPLPPPRPRLPRLDTSVMSPRQSFIVCLDWDKL